MCGRKAKRDPRIDEEQKKAREDAEAAKEQAEAKKEAERKKLLEMEKEKAASEAATAEADIGKADRQSELEKPVIQEGELTKTGLRKGTPKGLPKSAAALRRQRSARAGRKGRRSLLTSSGGGIGFYSRFN